MQYGPYCGGGEEYFGDWFPATKVNLLIKGNQTLKGKGVG
jgi:hypothetical protein